MKESAPPRSLLRTGVPSSWPEEALAAIHAAGLVLLARVGLKALSPAVRELLLGVGCTAGAGDRILIPDAAVTEALVEGVLAGSFLGVRQTRAYLRREACPTTLSYHGGLQEWLSSGRTNVLEAARERMWRHLADEPVRLPAAIEERLCGLIDEAGRELGLSEWPDPRRLLDEARTALAGRAARGGALATDGGPSCQT